MAMTPDSNVLNIPEVARVGIRLVMRDARFRDPVRTIGSLLGRDLAVAYPAKGPELDTAIVAFSDACRRVGFVRCTALSTREATGHCVRFDGCEDVLGYRVAGTGRTLCSFDEGLVESYLKQALGQSNITVHETECLGKGDASCLFVIGR